jgi:KaiC/GvpD/RAD55 family RecA-like ATPase
MASYLTETLYRFCTEDHYSFYLQNRAKFAWIQNKWIDGEELVSAKTFAALIIYMESNKRCPESVDALLAYVIHNPHGVTWFEKSESIDLELKDVEDDDRIVGLDMQMLFEALMSTARKVWVSNSMRLASSIALGAQKTPDKAKETGVNAAIQFIRSEMAQDWSQDAPAIAGMLHENIEHVKHALKDKLMDGGGERFPLGLSHIDNCVVVGKQNLKFIGVLGMSGDGKTTLTNFICYNWLRQGARILYISTEHTPQEIWEFMAFLHQTHPDYDFTLPSLSDWENRKVVVDDLKNMATILSDIQTRKNLPGLLDCQQMRDWDSIVDYLTTNHQKNKYDILIIDYLARLDVPGDARFRDQAMKKLVHDAQGLTRSFGSNKGLILLTPIQVNREGNKKARNAEEGEERYDLNAISSISEYQHDLDLCLSVWSDEDMKMGGRVEIQVLKKRKGKQPPVARMDIDTYSGAFEYVGAPAETQQMWDRTMDDVMAASSNEQINEDWGV